MMVQKKIMIKLGDEPPFIESGQSKLPDKREVSARWFLGTFITGITSTFLMGTAIFVALHQDQYIAMPIVKEKNHPIDQEQRKTKNPRIIELHQIKDKKNDRRRLEFSSIKKNGDKKLIQKMALVEINMNLTEDYKSKKNYPSFNPLIICMEPEPNKSFEPENIQVAAAKNQTFVKVSPFPDLEKISDNIHTINNEADIENIVRTAARILEDGEIKTTSLHFMLPKQKFNSLIEKNLTHSHEIKIIPENFSISHVTSEDNSAPYAEKIIPISSEISIQDLFVQNHYVNAEKLSKKFEEILDVKKFPSGSVLRLYLEKNKEFEIVRTSFYKGARHIATIALDDNKNYISVQEPKANPILRMAFGSSSFVTERKKYKTVYDTIFQASYAYGISEQTIQKILRTLASSIDLQASVRPTDKMKLVFSNPDEKDNISSNSQLLYISANFSGNSRTLYLYEISEGKVDYFDRNGRSSRQFLIRNPVPNGRFTSNFGHRKHPILGYVKMHAGVDWSAPLGTPILAVGDGVVEKSGWTIGYGKQTIIKHANGYISSYAHQSKIPKEIVPGEKVRQGQIIGYVGSTGLSTGSHLHYELIVNGTKVDPMRIRLPAEETLLGEDLNSFKQERDNLDQTIENQTLS